MDPTSSQLFLCPSTTVATNHVLAELRDHGRGRPACVLLPNLRASAQLASQIGDSAGTHLWQFYQLRDHILRQRALPLRLIDDTTVRRLVAQTLREACEGGVLTSFASISDTPGFAVEIVRWLREMKSRGVPPEAVEASGEAGNERDRQLAWLYRRYGERLAALNGIDSDGGLWLAAEALERDATLCLDLRRLIVTGFDQYSPVQVRLLGSLAARIPASIYLLWDANRPPGAAALARLAATRSQLTKSIPLDETDLPEDGTEEPELAHLRRSLFEAVPQRTVIGSLRAIAAPGREGEVRLALREAKRLLADGVEPACVALLSTQPSAYSALVLAVAEEYGVPVGADTGLGENPAIATLLSLLALSPDFPRGATLAALRSPYCSHSGLTGEQVSDLSRLSASAAVIGGREQWLAAIRSGEGEAATDEGDLADGQQSGRGLELAELAKALDAWFSLVTPPVTGSPDGYRRWIEQTLLGAGSSAEERSSLRIEHAAGEGPYAERDRRTLEILERVMRRLAIAAGAAPGPDAEMPWDEYRAGLLAEVSAARIPAGPGNAIRFGPLESGRAITVDHLFVLGLAADVFPGRPPADVFYSAAERREKPDILLNPVPNSQACLWWQLLGNARQTITLLRPRLNEKGSLRSPRPIGRRLWRRSAASSRSSRRWTGFHPAQRHAAPASCWQRWPGGEPRRCLMGWRPPGRPSGAGWPPKKRAIPPDRCRATRGS